MSNLHIQIGTAIESWSSIDALSKCPHTKPPTASEHDVPGASPFWSQLQHDYSVSSHVNPPPSNTTDSVLWYAMVYPFLRTTIKGVIWYLTINSSSIVSWLKLTSVVWLLGTKARLIAFLLLGRKTV